MCMKNVGALTRDETDQLSNELRVVALATRQLEERNGGVE